MKKNGLYQAYLWNPATKASTWQSTDYGGFSKTIRLSSLQDEGDCTGVFLAAKHDLFVLPHRDSMHKLHREECLATQDVPQISLAKKQILLLLKFEKAPWKTGAFGRRLNEAKQTVAQVPANGFEGLRFTGLGRYVVGNAADGDTDGEQDVVNYRHHRFAICYFGSNLF